MKPRFPRGHSPFTDLAAIAGKHARPATAPAVEREPAVADEGRELKITSRRTDGKRAAERELAVADDGADTMRTRSTAKA